MTPPAEDQDGIPLSPGPAGGRLSHAVRAAFVRPVRAVRPLARLSSHAIFATYLPLALLLGAVTFYSVVFGRLTVHQHDRYATFGFDLGIFDQALWLLSRLDVPFVTVRGLHFFGNHVNFSSVLLVPFYWLGAGPRFLAVFNTLALAAAAVPLWLIARDRLGSAWAGLSVGVTFLLLPSVEWINRWQFHPDTLALLPFLLAWWFSLRRWWKAYAVAVLLVLLAKEDAAMVVAVLGILVAARLDRRVGLATTAAAVGWFILATDVILPHYTHGLGPFYTSLYQGLGDGPGSIAWNALRHPSVIVDRLFEAARLTYYWKLFAPVVFLPFLAPAALAVMAMALPAPGRQRRLEPLADLRHRFPVLTPDRRDRDAGRDRGRAVSRPARPRADGTSWCLSCWPPWWRTSNGRPRLSGRSTTRGSGRRGPHRMRPSTKALRLVPPDAAVSASYNLVPHLTHRTQVYEFPNPWIVTNWGVQGEDPPDPDRVQYLVVLDGPGSTVERITGARPTA